jgi:hypothetical protein
MTSVSFDIISPEIRIPVINKVLPFKNEIVFLSNFKYVDQRSKINVEKDNNTICSISASTDYEILKYFRLLVGVNLDRFKYCYNADLNYYDISLISKLTIQL